MLVRPWLDMFACDWSDSELDKRLAVPVNPLSDLRDLPAEAAHTRLFERLSSLVVPSEQMRSIVRDLAAVARTFAATRYSDHKAILEVVYGNAAVPRSPLPRCLTGLAGTGKSEILKAFGRVFGQRVMVEVPLHGNFEARGMWSVSAADSRSVSRLLRPLFRDNESHRSIPATMACREAGAQLICMVLTDEFQFLSRGSGANALAAKLLGDLMRIGPPLVFATNFSMVHRLALRPQEERQRTLSCPILVRPEALNSQCWNKLVVSQLATSHHFSKLAEAEGISQLLHSYTFGIPRSLTTLLCRTYMEFRRRRNSTHVTIDDVMAAYLSHEFSDTRKTVAELVQGVVRPERLADDLRCPFEDARPVTQRNEGSVVTHPAQQEHERRIGEAALRSAMTAAERQAASQVNALTPQKGRRQPAPPSSVTTLKEGAAKFRALKDSER